MQVMKQTITNQQIKANLAPLSLFLLEEQKTAKTK